MSRNAKFDAYFNLLNNEDCKEICVPAESAPKLSYNVHVYQHAKHRNTKGLILGVETRFNPQTMMNEYWVRVKGDGRWGEESK